MAVNLITTLERFRSETGARAQQAAAERGYRFLQAEAPSEQLCAWIDLHFAPSFWSSEVRTSHVWYAQTMAGELAGFAAYGSAERTYPWLRAYRDRADVGLFGPYGVAPLHRKAGIGGLLLDAALASLAAQTPYALIPAVGGERLIATYIARTGARIADEYAYPLPRGRVVLLASGNGTNAGAVIDATAAGRLAFDLRVITNVADAFVRERARDAGVHEEAIVWDRSRERAAFDARLQAAVAAHEPDLVLLLGWMHLLPPAFLERFPETLNVHPAFLPFDPHDDEVTMPDGSCMPAFRGARALQATIEGGARWSGASVHRVTAAIDRGGLLVRTPVALGRTPTLGSLRDLVQPLEHAAVECAVRRWSFERP